MSYKYKKKFLLLPRFVDGKLMWLTTVYEKRWYHFEMTGFSEFDVEDWSLGLISKQEWFLENL